VHTLADKPWLVGAVTLVLMVGDWVLRIFQERERVASYARHYESYPVDTIEGNPLLRAAVAERRFLEPRHLGAAVVASVAVAFVTTIFTPTGREVFVGFVWGVFLLVITTHLGNLAGYRASRRGLEGKLRMHLRTGLWIQAGRYLAWVPLLLVLALASGSAFVWGVFVAGIVSSARQLLYLRRLPPVED